MTEPMYRISRQRRVDLPWHAYGIKYTKDEATRRKRMLERKGWRVNVYPAS